MKDNQRRFLRVPFKVMADITTNEKLYYENEIINLGMGGCLLSIDEDFKAGSGCRVTIRLTGTNSELSVGVQGKIVRCDNGKAAIKFTQIDPDSLFHLKNIVRYNSKCPEKVEKEINKYIGVM